MTRVVLENVTKAYGDSVAVDRLNLEIESGSFFSIVGPSGCGKTTTMRMIAGLERPDTGRIWIGDELVFSSKDSILIPPGRRGVGMVFQSYALWPHMTVKDNISFGLKSRKLDREVIEKQTQDVLQLMQIPQLGSRFPSELSGGQQQRVALARELVTDSRVLFMDEPLSNLDARLRMDMRTELKRIHAATGRTIVYVTHDQLEALTLSTALVVMNAGTMQQHGTPDEIYVRPINKFVSEFIGLTPINFIDGQVTNGSFTLADEVRLPGLEQHQHHIEDGTKVTLALRPEDIKLADEPTKGILVGKVETVLTAGSSAFVQVLLNGGGHPVRLMVQEFHLGEGMKARSKGEQVYLTFDASRAMLFDPDTGASLRTTPATRSPSRASLHGLKDHL